MCCVLNVCECVVYVVCCVVFWGLGLVSWALANWPWAMGLRPCALGLGAWALGLGSWTLEPWPWGLGRGPWGRGAQGASRKFETFSLGGGRRRPSAAAQTVMLGSDVPQEGGRGAQGSIPEIRDLFSVVPYTHMYIYIYL